MGQQTIVQDAWREAWEPPPEIPIWDWLEENITLPFSPLGKFQADDIPAIREVLAAMADPTVRLVVLSCAVQTFKSVVMLLFLAWKLANRPSPSLFCQPTKPEVLTVVKSRLKPMLEASAGTKHLIPSGRDRDAYTASFIMFQNGMPLHMGPANNTFLHGKSIDVLMMDECHLLQANDNFNPIQAAAARLTRFPTSKMILASQGSIQDDPFDRKWQETDKAELHFCCPACDEWQPYRRECIEFESIKDEAGEYDFAAIAPTVKMRCRNEDCGHIMEDTDKQRRQLIETARFIGMDDTAPAKSRGFRIPAYANQSWSGLIEDYLRAKVKMWRGDPADMKTFIQQREGQMWGEADDGDFTIDVKGQDFTRAEALEWEDEARWKVGAKGRIRIIPASADRGNSEFRCRIMAVDVQHGSFFLTVTSWADDGRMLVLTAEHVDLWEDIARIAAKYEVHPALVFVDTGDQRDAVLEQCIKYGWRGVRGDRRDGFLHNPKGEQKSIKLYSRPQRAMLGKKTAYTFNLATTPLKDQLSRLLSMPDQCQVPSDMPPEFAKHLDSERRQKGKSGKPLWVAIGKRPNHWWDCLYYCLGGAHLIGLFQWRQDVDESDASDGSS